MHGREFLIHGPGLFLMAEYLRVLRFYLWLSQLVTYTMHPWFTGHLATASTANGHQNTTKGITSTGVFARTTW